MPAERRDHIAADNVQDVPGYDWVIATRACDAKTAKVATCWRLSNPYCDSGEDRIRRATRFVGLTGLSVLPETVIELFLVAVAIAARRNLKPSRRADLPRLAVPASGERLVNQRTNNSDFLRQLSVNVANTYSVSLGFVPCGSMATYAL
jgi:hypothetical protein